MMAHCPKCGKGRLPKRSGAPRACRRCGTLRQLIFPALPSYAVSDADWLKEKVPCGSTS